MRPMPLSEPFLRRPSFLWQQPGWPDLRVDAVVLAPALDSARMEQGRLLGLLDAIGLWPAGPRGGALRGAAIAPGAV